MGRARTYVEPTIDEMREEALKHATKSAFKTANPKFYNYAWTKGLLDDVCEHMTDARKTWTIDRLKEEAAKYSSRGEFQVGSKHAYAAARYHRVLDEICEHMGRRKLSSYDAIYICRVRGTDIYKIGVTSQSLGLTRIQQLRDTFNLDLHLISLTCFPERATVVEQALLRIGTRAPAPLGSTEFREWTKKELKKALDYLSHWVCETL